MDYSPVLGRRFRALKLWACCAATGARSAGPDSRARAPGGALRGWVRPPGLGDLRAAALLGGVLPARRVDADNDAIMARCQPERRGVPGRHQARGAHGDPAGRRQRADDGGGRAEGVGGDPEGGGRSRWIRKTVIPLPLLPFGRTIVAMIIARWFGAARSRGGNWNSYPDYGLAPSHLGGSTRPCRQTRSAGHAALGGFSAESLRSAGRNSSAGELPLLECRVAAGSVRLRSGDSGKERTAPVALTPRSAAVRRREHPPGKHPDLAGRRARCHRDRRSRGRHERLRTSRLGGREGRLVLTLDRDLGRLAQGHGGMGEGGVVIFRIPRSAPQEPALALQALLARGISPSAAGSR